MSANPIPDAIDETHVPEVVPTVVPDEAPDTVVPQVLWTAVEDSDTNTEILQINDHLVTSTIVVHDTNWSEVNL